LLANIDKIAKVKMVGFKGHRKRVSPDLMVKVNVCREYQAGADGGSPSFDEKVDVWVSPEGRKHAWASKLASVLKPIAIKALKAEGMFPTNEKGYRVAPECVGMVEIGQFTEQNSYSDDSYLAIRADTDRLARMVAGAVENVLPVSGGGVHGTYGYKGSGLKKGSDGEYVYHYSSFGIGD
tara:strand:- start:2688 stop:3227 length:540 start_codon:yes stop_codon:yes gene_type:complete